MDAAVGIDAGTDAGIDGGPVIGPDSGQDAGSCAARCAITGPLVDCDTFAVVTSAGDRHVLTVDMTGFTELQIGLTLCDPTGFTFQIGDSPTNDGGGGDSGSSSNDAELLIEGAMLSVFANDVMPGTAVLVDPDYAVAAPCAVRELTIRDQAIVSREPGFELRGPELLRLNPPVDTEGTPDALWHVGVGRTVGRVDRSGAGVTALELCAR
jgi:hypothetical protein